MTSERLVTLMELVEFYAEPFYRLSGMIGQIIVRIDCNIVNFDVGKTIGSTLGEMLKEVERLDLPASKKQLVRIREYAFSTTGEIVQTAVINRMIKELHGRLIDELEDQVFLAVPGEMTDYYRQKEPPFGVLVQATFPQMVEDISESSKCLALRRATAAVFHLMRVMELGVHAFGTAVGITLVEEKVWQVILDGINKKIKAMEAKQARTKVLAEAASHLYNVKVAWRNEVMHPKQTYTAEEAENIFANVKTFINDLAGLLP
jgi:hypothetical protein